MVRLHSIYTKAASRYGYKGTDVMTVGLRRRVVVMLHSGLLYDRRGEGTS